MIPLDEIVFIDFETSGLDTETCDVLCLCARRGDRTAWWSPRLGPPDTILALVQDAGFLCAHNAEAFDRRVWERLDLPNRGWLDTMEMAARCGLPQNLGKLATWFKLESKGDRAVVNRWYRLMGERSPLRDDGTMHPLFGDVLDYCQLDVDLLAGIYERLVRLDPDDDPQGVVLHRLLSTRGFYFDQDEARRLIALGSSVRHSAADVVVDEATLRSQVKLRAWLTERGYEVENVRRETLEELLEEVEGVDDEVANVLLARIDVAMIFEKKILRGIADCGDDSRIRYALRYYGAHTGRWSGRSFQPQNLVRPLYGPDGEPWSEQAFAAAAIKELRDIAKRAGVTPLHLLRTTMRGLIAAAPGKLLVGGDLAQIEARVLAWLAGCPSLEHFGRKPDPYQHMAAKVFGGDPMEMRDERRHLGKGLVLGCGFGMGEKRFAATCEQSRLDLAALGVSAKKAVDIYRDAHPRITAYWRTLERRALTEIANGASPLVIDLPSGRTIRYHEPRITDGRITFASRFGRRDLWGGIFTENVVQATARDIMVDCAIRAERAGLPVVLTIHDEIVCEVDEADAESAAAELKRIMTTGPAWADGLPLGADVWWGRNLL